MPSLKQIGTICFVFSLILISQKSYSDIAANNSNPSCDNSTLNTYTGPAALEAKWNANTIQLKWYKDDEQLTVQTAANQCTYDGTMTLPSTRPTKTGYDFNGWKVKTGGSSSGSSINLMCGLTNEILAIEPNHYWGKGYETDMGNCKYDNEGVDCSSTPFDSMTANTWKIQTSAGVYEGIASCNNYSRELSASQQAEYDAALAEYEAARAALDEEMMVLEEEYGQLVNTYGGEGNIPQAEMDALMARAGRIELEAEELSRPKQPVATRPASMFNSNSTGQYCWCKATSYTQNGGAQCSLSSAPWAVYSYESLDSTCGIMCAYLCTVGFMYDNNAGNQYNFRAALLSN